MDELIGGDELANAASLDELLTAVQAFIDNAESRFESYLNRPTGKSMKDGRRFGDELSGYVENYRDELRKFRDAKVEVENTAYTLDEEKQLDLLMDAFELKMLKFMVLAVHSAGVSFGYLGGFLDGFETVSKKR